MNVTLIVRCLSCKNGLPRRLLCDHTTTVQLCSFYGTNPLRDKKTKAVGTKKQHFVDWRRIRVVGGAGGNGSCSFLRLWCNPEAGPSGGDGGNGGHIIFEASGRLFSLHTLESVYLGAHGDKGDKDDCSGKSADHTFVQVPCGTVIKDEKGRILCDLNNEGDMFLAARGGAGGKGNHFFMSNDNKAPLISEIGAEGENKSYTLELKTIAHAGLIGFPNAGKSTLLRAISRARPKIAAYPFTTLNPHIGIVHYDDYEQIAVADIPGLIPDAHLNRGLGIGFLRHIERCLCLLYVLDLSQPSPWDQLDILRNELEHYKSGLSDRTHAIVGNKIDLPEAQENLKILQKKIDLPIFAVSAKFGTNILSLLRHLRYLYDEKNLKAKLNMSQ